MWTQFETQSFACGDSSPGNSTLYLHSEKEKFVNTNIVLPKNRQYNLIPLLYFLWFLAPLYFFNKVLKKLEATRYKNVDKNL